MSIKNSSDIIGNRTRDLPTCIAVPQPTVLPRAPPCDNKIHKINFKYLLVLVFESNISINFMCLFHIMCFTLMCIENEHVVCISGENCYGVVI
jgi:hypothetical protein